MSSVAAVFLGYLAVLAAGDALAHCLPKPEQRVTPSERIAVAFGLGLLVLSGILFWGSWLAPGRMGPFAVGIPVLLFVVATRAPSRWIRAMRELRLDPMATLILAFFIAANVGASLTTDLGWDGAFVWEIKARTVFRESGIPESAWSDVSRRFSHPDYPWLVPLGEAWLYFVAGEARPIVAKALFPGFYAALLLLVHGVLTRRCSRTMALVAVVSLGTIPQLSAWAATGYADVPLAFAWTASVLFLEAGLESNSRRDLVLGAVFAVLAAWTKREGLVLAAFQAVVLMGAMTLETRRARVVAIVALAASSALVLGPWLACLQAHGTPGNDFAALSLAEIVERRDRAFVSLTMMLLELRDRAHWGLLWFLFAAALVGLVAGNDRPRRTYLAASVVVPLAALAASFLFSVWEPFTSHLAAALDRLVMQQAPVAVCFVVMEIGRRARGALPYAAA